jgi:integrase
MIQKYITRDKKTQADITQYRVRVYQKSNSNPAIRVTKQEGGIDTEAHALKREIQFKKECEREVLDLESKGVLFSDLISAWDEHCRKLKVATGKRSETTHGDYVGGIRKWFKDYWNKPATEINPYRVTEVFENMKTEGLCFGHRKKLKQILKSIFDYGIQSGTIHLKRSPTFEVVLSRDNEKKPEILNLQELQLLVQKSFSSNHEWKYIWSAALLTGMRSGELHALEWDDVDFENKLLNVNKTYNVRVRGFNSTKAGYWRQVPISQDLEQILAELKKLASSSKFVFPRSWEWDKGLQARVLRRFCFLHGLPSIKFHTLRACFATQMLRSGVEAAKVMKICGWKELKTMQLYIRLAGIEVQGTTESIKLFPNGLAA